MESFHFSLTLGGEIEVLAENRVKAVEFLKSKLGGGWNPAVTVRGEGGVADLNNLTLIRFMSLD